MNERKRLKPYFDYLDSQGVRVVESTKTQSNHFKMLVTSKGKRGIFVIASSTSDRRSFQNWKSDVRKWLGEARA